MIKNYFLMLATCLFSYTFYGQTYSVSAIPFQTYSVNSVASFNSDDVYSASIPIGFNFTFYGITYTNVSISSNGYLDFSNPAAGSFSQWNFSAISIPNATLPKNSFFGCYHDTNNSVVVTPPLVQSVTYGLVGSAPYRKFIVMFNNVPQFSCGNNAISSFQMVLHETLNTMDSQIIDKPLCSVWNGGRAIVGIQNASATAGITAPGRDATASWIGNHEGWRFQLPNGSSSYNYTKCDDNTDGFESFNLELVQNALFPANPSSIIFYSSLADVNSGNNAISTLLYTNVNPFSDVIYATGNGAITTVNLKVVDCNNDFDLDTVATASEDINGDGNLANDDTDLDGVPDFIDNDDDADMILTSFEYVFTNRNSNNANSLLDTDNDGIPNYRDNDDDGDGILTVNEDYNANHNPADDDTNGDGVSDYLQSAVALGLSDNQLYNSISLYPNPASSILNFDNHSSESIKEVSIYSIRGSLVKSVKETNVQSISVSDLQSGVYFVKLTLENNILNYKFIKE